MIIVAYIKRDQIAFVEKNLGRALTAEELRNREQLMQVSSRTGADRVVSMLREDGYRAYWYETPE